MTLANEKGPLVEEANPLKYEKLPSNFADNSNTTTFSKWQTLRIARQCQLTASTAALICELSGLGGLKHV